MNNKIENANSDFAVSAGETVLPEIIPILEMEVDAISQTSKKELENDCDDVVKAEAEIFLPEPSLFTDAEEDELGDWEIQDLAQENWSSTSESTVENYEKFSEESYEILDEENNTTRWVDVSHMKTKTRSASIGSSWEVVSVQSAAGVSLCSVNDLAKSVIDEFEMNCNVTENSTIEKKEAEESISRKNSNVEGHSNIQCGLILFQKDGAEVACVIKGSRSLMNPDDTLMIPFVSPIEGESPLEAAVRGFIEQTNCENLDAVAILNKVIQFPKGNSLLLLFPAVVSRELNFGPSENTVSWNNCYNFTMESKMYIYKQNLSNIICAAYQLLLQYRDELPTLMDDDVAEILDIATYQLHEYIKKEGKGITFHEIKNFFRCNQDDLEKILQDCSRMEKRDMVRKLVAQLPIHSKENTSVLDYHRVEYHQVTALGQLEQILLQNYGENGLDWKNIELDLRTCPCIYDGIVRDVLEQAGWSSRTQRFKFNMNLTGSIVSKEFAQRVLFAAINDLQQATRASIF